MQALKVILLAAACAALMGGCGKDDGEGAGEPELVKAAQEIAKAGCACEDISCTYKVESSDGRGVKDVIVGAKMDKLTASEKKDYLAASKEYKDCERKLSAKKRAEGAKAK